MTTLAPLHFVSVDDYLAKEDGADIRHEYIDGQLYAMTGASRNHGLIVGNLYALLHPLLRGTPCQLFASDMKVRLRINHQEIFYYPDLLLSCDKNDRATYYCSQHCLLVEVLSDSTARIDRREKLWAYQSIPSLQENLLVSQTVREVQIHRRKRDWAPETLTNGPLRLECLDVEVPLDVIYEDVPAL